MRRLGGPAVLASVRADARVKQGVGDVHQHVHQDDEGRGEDHDADDDGQVLLVDRLDGDPAEAGNAEDRLDEDDSAELSTAVNSP